MDSEKAERLSRLQMEDLGTARREHISTTDSRKVKKARLEDIEATRLSNQPGTEAQRLAEQNRQQLTEWKNVFKRIGDTVDVESLDELLNGQSHRLQLRAALHGSGSYDSGKSLKTTDDYPKLSEASLSASTRGSRSRGRGRGIAGTRGRGDVRVVSGRIPSSTSNRASDSKLGHRAHQASGACRTSLDPALEINNSDSNGKGYEKQAQDKPPYQFGGNRGNGNRSQMPAVVKTRRPMDGLPRLLSPPESFLAEARKLLQRVSEATPAAAQNESNLHSTPVTASPCESRTAQPSTAQKTPLPNNKAEAGHDEPALMTTLAIAPQENRMPQLSTAQATSNQITSDMPNQNPESTNGIPTTTNKDQSASESALNRTSSEVLLDLSSTPPTKDSFLSDNNLIMSPSLQELEGLEFMQSLTNALGSTSSPIFQRLDCEEPSKNTIFDGKSSAFHQADEDGPCDKFQRDIEMLCKLMASTSLSDKHRESLEECKAELEAKLRNFQRTPPLIPATLESSAESPIDGGGALPVSKNRDSPSLLSRLNVTAAPFVPSRLDMSPTPTRARAKSVSFAVHPGHIIGNHLLPGRREPQVAVQPKETHIFGDHVLPGRRQVSESSSTQIKFSIPRKRTVLPSLKIPGFGGLENPALDSLHPLGDTQQTLLHTGPVNKVVRKPSAPEDQLQQSIHAPKENKTPVTRSVGQALGGLQASIYAVREESKPIR
ncbi:hypothetical protein BDV38DRAFT_283558 [Aspergillus pseudotamarii]|uniref:Uncharacterized protein n=1 Tax=Aspergillus pseudotamarii TaxID=132259 RepID=A0A5N6SQM2_ASPPS|nr:uncharacterized protein BDV38DRAFT_283558 [Aspergillus pseudotamarii]KAE8136885.1 hypothetical protein BDV38DRAFT_283558 [Aspergillus pseudotamarii]